MSHTYFCQHCNSVYLRSQDKITPGFCSVPCSVSEQNRKSQKSFVELQLARLEKLRTGVTPDPVVAAEEKPRVREYACECCGIVDYNNKPLKLILHHRDQNTNNYDTNNLMLVCPNCLSQHTALFNK